MDSRKQKYWIEKIKKDSDERILMDILLSEKENDVFAEIYEIHEASGELRNWKKFDSAKAWDKVSKQTSISKFSILKYASAAAVILIFGISLLFLNNDKSFSAGHIESHIVLSDGSDITLYPNAELIVSNSFNKENREIQLKGDAYFNVSKDRSKPFIIKMQDAEVKVLGTVFYVDQSENGVKVDLISGEVEIENKEGVKAILSKNKTAVINEKINIRELNEKDLLPAKDLFLDNVSIKNAVNKLNEIYGRKIIELEESENKLWDEPFHTTVKNSSVREFINGLELVFNVKVINSKGKFIVSSLEMK